MKRYQFRLAPLLRLRRAEEESAREGLRAANDELRRRIAVRDGRAERYRAIAAGPLATSAEALLAERQGGELAAGAVASARKAVTTAAADAALAQVAWSGASRRVKILERLDDRRRAEHAAAEARADVAEVDDLTTSRHRREAGDEAAREKGAR